MYMKFNKNNFIQQPKHKIEYKMNNKMIKI